jgi:hypothetical protein
LWASCAIAITRTSWRLRPDSASVMTMTTFARSTARIVRSVA